MKEKIKVIFSQIVVLIILIVSAYFVFTPLFVSKKKQPTPNSSIKKPVYLEQPLPNLNNIKSLIDDLKYQELEPF